MDKAKYNFNGTMRLAAMVALMTRGEGEMDYLHRRDSNVEEPDMASEIEAWRKAHAERVREVFALDKEKEELLDALQNLHSRNERYDRSVRIKLLLKHGRIQK